MSAGRFGREGNALPLNQSRYREALTRRAVIGPKSAGFRYHQNGRMALVMRERSIEFVFPGEEDARERLPLLIRAQR